jgi:hypothetical protein
MIIPSKYLFENQENIVDGVVIDSLLSDTFYKVETLEEFTLRRDRDKKSWYEHWSSGYSL